MTNYKQTTTFELLELLSAANNLPAQMVPLPPGATRGSVLIGRIAIAFLR